MPNLHNFLAQPSRKAALQPLKPKPTIKKQKKNMAQWIT